MPILQGNIRVLWLQAKCSPVCDRKQQLWESGLGIQRRKEEKKMALATSLSLRLLLLKLLSDKIFS